MNEYIYLDNTPIGYVNNGTLYYIETDHLGTPRQVLRPAVAPANDTLVWKWDFAGSVFGTHSPNPEGITFNLRYPGQYFDQETGLHYNYFRDYEPGTGRYVESDPIGLKGSISTYGYTAQNPLEFFDPTGTTQCDIDFALKFAKSRITDQTIPASVTTDDLNNEARKIELGRTTHFLITHVTHPPLRACMAAAACVLPRRAVAARVPPSRSGD